MFSIVWSCLSTVFICAWVSVHPNLPPRSQKHAFWRRLKLMFWTIVVPELVLAWALRQWYGAKMIADKYKGVYPSLTMEDVSVDKNRRSWMDDGAWSFSDHGRLYTCPRGCQYAQETNRAKFISQLQVLEECQ
jgi:hypothetical protein